MEFEYKGTISTLSNAKELKRWIRERKARFPTQARIAEKKKKKAAALELLRQKALESQEANRIKSLETERAAKQEPTSDTE